jgi:hypothetical protein
MAGYPPPSMLNNEDLSDRGEDQLNTDTGTVGGDVVVAAGGVVVGDFNTLSGS